MPFKLQRAKHMFDILLKITLKLENIILSEVSLAQKTKNCMFSLIRGH
jgi:hypothetical protein